MTQKSITKDTLNSIASFLVGLLVVFSAISCGTSTKSSTQSSLQSSSVPCTIPSDALVRWGFWNDSTGILKGVELDAQRRIWRYTASTRRENYDRDSIGVLSENTACATHDSVKSNLIAVQTLFQQAKVSRFIEYQRPSNRVAMRAVWTENLMNPYSKPIRDLFDSLCVIAMPSKP